MSGNSLVWRRKDWARSQRPGFWATCGANPVTFLTSSLSYTMAWSCPSPTALLRGDTELLGWRRDLIEMHILIQQVGAGAPGRDPLRSQVASAAFPCQVEAEGPEERRLGLSTEPPNARGPQLGDPQANVPPSALGQGPRGSAWGGRSALSHPLPDASSSACAPRRAGREAPHSPHTSLGAL